MTLATIDDGNDRSSPSSTLEAVTRLGFSVAVGAAHELARLAQVPTKRTEVSRPALIAIGAASEATQVAVRGMGATVRAGQRLAGPLGRLPGAGRVRAAAASLEQRGRAELRAGDAEAARALDLVVADVAEHPAVETLVLRIVDRILDPVLDRALPDVFDRLAAEPEPVRALIQDQSMSMATEMAATVRSSAAHGDELVDRLVGRVLRRKRATNGQQSTTIPPGTYTTPAP